MRQKRETSESGVVRIASAGDGVVAEDISVPRKRATRRHVNGSAMVEDEAVPTSIDWQALLEPEELTPEAGERMKKRREKNRIAAEKCRKKKKERENLLEEEASQLEEKNEELLEEIETLREEKERLKFFLHSHAISCHPNMLSAPTPAGKLDCGPISSSNLGESNVVNKSQLSE